MVLQEESVLLREICQSVLSEVEAIAIERGIAVRYEEAGDTELPMVIGDPDQLRKVILNLVGNSLKFTERGGKVIVRIVKRPDQIVLSVVDNGVGIPEKDHRKIFEKFGQSQNPLSRTHEGTGLGLTFVQDVLSQMRARIELQSQVGKGSCFTIYFHRAPRETEG